jgi:hypothetical protein
MSRTSLLSFFGEIFGGGTPDHKSSSLVPSFAAVAMTPSPKEPEPSRDFVKQSTLYQEFLAEREEILRHKWIESERLGYDIGFERALLDWIRKHREGWRAARRAQQQQQQQQASTTNAQPGTSSGPNR